jgi:hypothetical protein
MLAQLHPAATANTVTPERKNGRDFARVFALETVRYWTCNTLIWQETENVKRELIHVCE